MPFRNKANRPFTYGTPDTAQALLHEVDRSAAGQFQIPELVTTPQNRDRYIVRSLMEEAITSSQPEGAATTHKVDNRNAEILHIPPAADERPERMRLLCAFANYKADEPFIHPVIRAILLRIMLGYDHPYADGNGRTERALFYWCMAQRSCWLIEFVSIRSPGSFGRPRHSMSAPI